MQVTRSGQSPGHPGAMPRAILLPIHLAGEVPGPPAPLCFGNAAAACLGLRARRQSAVKTAACLIGFNSDEAGPAGPRLRTASGAIARAKPTALRRGAKLTESFSTRINGFALSRVIPQDARAYWSENAGELRDGSP